MLTILYMIFKQNEFNSIKFNSTFNQKLQDTCARSNNNNNNNKVKKLKSRDKAINITRFRGNTYSEAFRKGIYNNSNSYVRWSRGNSIRNAYRDGKFQQIDKGKSNRNTRGKKTILI